jgi:hemoglobin
VIVEYTRYRIPAERRDAFETAYAAAAAFLRDSPQCLRYELTHSVDEPDNYVLRIEWTSSKDHIEGFRGSPTFKDFLALVRPFIPDIQEMREYERTDVVGDGSAIPTLYDFAGGAEAFDWLTEVFYRHVLRDELVGPLFAHMDPNHPAHVAMFLSEVFGGPHRYSAERGGHPHMISQHLGKAITEPQRRRWVNLLQDAADEVGLPDDAEFRSAFLAYIEWGTRLAVGNSQPGAKPNHDEPMPRWGWGSMPPYQPPRP